MEMSKSNKQQSESSNKGSNPKEKETEYTFPSQNITIKATSPEEARKKLKAKLGTADEGDTK